MSQQSFEKITKIITAASQQEEYIDYDKQLAIAEGKDRFGDKKRALQYKEHLHKIVIIGIWIIGILLFILIPIRVFHLVAPQGWHWLKPDYLHSLDAVLFSSIIFSLASRYFSYYNLFPNNK